MNSIPQPPCTGTADRLSHTSAFSVGFVDLCSGSHPCTASSFSSTLESRILIALGVLVEVTDDFKTSTPPPPPPHEAPSHLLRSLLLAGLASLGKAQAR